MTRYGYFTGVGGTIEDLTGVVTSEESSKAFEKRSGPKRRSGATAESYDTVIPALNVLVIDDRFGKDDGLWNQFKKDSGLFSHTDKLVVLSGQVQQDDGTFKNDYHLDTILPTLRDNRWSLILLDLQFVAAKENAKQNNVFGAHLYQQIKGKYPNLHIVMMTGEHQEKLPDEIAYAPYISKDGLDWAELVCNGFLANGCAANKMLTPDQKRALLELTDKETANSDKMLDVFRDAYVKAKANAPICILGESGAGKEVIAKYIHRISRDGTPFVATGMGEHNSGDQSLDISSIFGIGDRVATGVSARKGLVELAGEGTLFFDEIGEMSPALQAASLRFLEDRKYTPVGGQPKDSKCRLLFATDRDLRSSDILRHQLFERIHINQAIVIPPLRNHREDIPQLAETFLKAACNEQGKKGIKFDKKALDSLCVFDFPGNIRELKNVVSYLVTTKGNHSLIKTEELTACLHKSSQQTTSVHRLADLVDIINNFSVDKLDPGLDGAQTGTLLKMEEAMIGLNKRCTEASLELKDNQLTPAVCYMIGKKRRYDRRFDFLAEGTSLVSLCDLVTKGKTRGTSGNKKSKKPVA